MLMVKETKSSKYPPRTFYNANNSDLTVAFAVDLNTLGEQLTKKAAGPNKYIGISLSQPLNINLLYDIIGDKNAKILNIAGNSIHTLNKYGISQDQINMYILNIIQQIHNMYQINKILTGGQSGVDLAGAVAGYKCGIPVEVNMPKGFIQRNINGIDISHTKEEIEVMIKK
jgi:hypothetical protein